MARLLRAFSIAVCVSALALTVAAETKVEVNGQVRVRTELDDKSFDEDAIAQSFTDLRTRASIKAIKDNNVTAFVQFQDSRRFGDGNLSGTLNDGMNVDIHQAWLLVNELWQDGIGLKAGRMEVNLGNERVFGSVGWHNVGRSWEGITCWLDRPTFKLAAYWLKKIELNSDEYNRDFDIGGATLDLKDQEIQVFGFFEKDADENETNDAGNIVASGVNRLDRLSLGLHTRQVSNSLDFEINGVYQFGNVGTGYNTDGVSPSEVDLAAFLFTVEVGHTIDAERKTRLAAGLDYASGDKDSDDKITTYDNLYYTGHKFRGYMDYFIGSNSVGLMDIVLRGQTQITDGWLAKLDFHYFQTAEEYDDPIESGTTSEVGMELDFTVVTTRIAGVTWVNGASAFLPKDSWVGEIDPSNGFWLYSMISTEF